MDKELLKIIDDTKDIPSGIDSTKLITSNRSFGVELEMILGNANKIIQYCQDIGHNVHNDGSIRGDNPIEVATTVLKGEDGAKQLVELMDNAKKFGYKTNSTCGTHIHLGAKDFYSKSNYFSSCDLKNLSLINENIFIELPLLKQMERVFNHESLNAFLTESLLQYNNRDGWLGNYTMYDGRTSNLCVIPVVYMGTYMSMLVRVSTLERLKMKYNSVLQGNSQVHLSTETVEGRNFKGNYMAEIDISKTSLLSRKKTEEWKKLRALFGVYSYFDTLFFAMLPSIRKKSDYCRPLANTYSFEDISKVKSQESLEKLWYKEQKLANVARAKRQRGSLNGDFNTRYHSLNIHALFYEMGYNTVEIRTHHGTTNAHSILAWVALNQLILDTVVSNADIYYEVESANINNSVEEKTNLLFKIFNIKKDSDLRKFIENRLSIYSNINLQ